MNQSLSDQDNTLEEQVLFWKRFSELAAGRNEVLKMAARGEPLAITLQTLCEQALRYNPDYFCSVLSIDHENGTLHPTASAAIPDFYNEALDGAKIGAGIGSCGTSALTGKRVLVEDTNTHPYWTQYKQLALAAGMQACWSEPIIGSTGKIYGTFAMYSGKPGLPSEVDLQFIEVCANFAALVYEHDANKQELLEANRQLSQTLDERTAELHIKVQALEEAILAKEESYDCNLYSEKMRTTKSLLVGVAHEISTPLGVALTAISTADNSINNVINTIQNKERLSKQQLVGKFEEIRSAININYSSLLKAAELLNRFKEIDAENEAGAGISQFSLQDFFDEINRAMSSRIGVHRLEVDGKPFTVSLMKCALWQVVVELIENSITHGFRDIDQGNIAIGYLKSGNDLVINFQDDGVGIKEGVGDKVFDPFFVESQDKSTLGLGLSVISNVVKQRLNGNIRSVRAPVGARFEIHIPLK